MSLVCFFFSLKNVSLSFFLIFFFSFFGHFVLWYCCKTIMVCFSNHGFSFGSSIYCFMKAFKHSSFIFHIVFTNQSSVILMIIYLCVLPLNCLLFFLLLLLSIFTKITNQFNGFSTNRHNSVFLVLLKWEKTFCHQLEK